MVNNANIFLLAKIYSARQWFMISYEDDGQGQGQEDRKYYIALIYRRRKIKKFYMLHFSFKKQKHRNKQVKVRCGQQREVVS